MSGLPETQMSVDILASLRFACMVWTNTAGKKGIVRGSESMEPLQTCRLTLVCRTLLFTVGSPEDITTHPYVPAK
jgi:hypothetical protein